MADLEGLSHARAILLATHLCASGNVTALPRLHAQFPECLPLERLLRIILTFLPESTEPQHYTTVVQVLADGVQSQLLDGDVDVSSVEDLSEAVARKRVRKLHLLPLKYPFGEEEDDTDPLTQFLIHRAHRIDSETSLQPLILGLLAPFYERLPIIRTWLISSLLPLFRLNYEYYPNNDETLSLDVLESMDENTAINVLLSMTGPRKDSTDLVKNLRGLVGPRMYGSKRLKRRKLSETTRRNSLSFPQDETTSQVLGQSGWETVDEWLLSRSLVDYGTVTGAFANWDGPEDVDLGGYEDGHQQVSDNERADLRTRYGQTGLAIVYANSDTSKAALDGAIQIVSRVAKLLDLEEFSTFPGGQGLPSLSFDVAAISSSSRASLLQNALLVPSNPLTHPSTSSISFLRAVLASLKVAGELGHSIPCRLATSMCLHSNEDTQLLELRNIVASITKQTKQIRDWSKIRQRLLWLRGWRVDQLADAKDYHGLFWKVPLETVETEILKTLLAVREYKLAVDIYVNTKPAPLNPEQVETAVRDAIFVAYDNASNGNRTRGGMKKAYDILQTFQPHFPNSPSFRQIQALISATHALSFYSLTLQHGVPFQPVSIRVHPDPLSLIEKVLDQNQKSYTKLDDLLSIGRSLAAAGLPIYPSSIGDAHNEQLPTPLQGDDASATVERRIISLSISSALSANDFGTAYSYILTRLTPPSLLPTTSASTSLAPVKDDISWRAVYNAGRYRSPTLSSATARLQSQISHLSQRMELLSLALVLAPTPDPLPEILGAWRRCDEEMSVLQAREAEESDTWDTKGDALTTIPGGFGPSDHERDAFETEQQRAKRARARRSGSYSHRDDGEEEAPMGLFEVARGAAMAFRKNAFPLHDAASARSSIDSGTPATSIFEGQQQQQQQRPEEGRVRKRDVVSNMVTGGLVSGIGWVLGAQPVNHREH